MLARDGRSKPCAVPGPARAGGRGFRAVLDPRRRRGGGEEPATTQQPRATATATPKKAAKRKRKVYVVKPGDTPSGIAEKTGVSLEQLEEANPDLDPQLLAPGQRIRIPQ